MLLVAGTLLFYLLLQASIALHEAGHLVLAKLFGVKVKQFMIGFGPTMKSWQRGETEYGFKWIPFGGFNRMIGMLAPRRGPAGRGRLSRMIDNSREAALSEVEPGDEDRVFYAKPWWQKALISFAGPAMSFLLAGLFISIWLLGIGYQEHTLTLAKVKPESPAAAAGLRPGDTVTAFEGRPVASKVELDALLAAASGRDVQLTVRRDGQPVNIPLTLKGDLGATATAHFARQTPRAVAERLWTMSKGAIEALAVIPKTIGNLWTAVTGGERDEKGAIGLVGVSRIGGEALAGADSFKERAAWFLMLIGTANFSFGVFNLLPLPPLDGGQIVGSLWEGLKRLLARLLGRPDPGHVDVAKALPLTMVVGVLLVTLLALTLYLDIVNPVHYRG